jgi:hypothetical protein
LAHLSDTALVERSGADVTRDVISNKSVGQLTVILGGLVPERGLALLNVAVGADDFLAFHAHHLAWAFGARAV